MNKESLIIVTGGAGFIGSNLVRHLNKAGYKNIKVVDDLTDSRKFKNLTGLEFGYVDKDDFWKDVLSGNIDADYVFHLGAISSTTHENGKELMEENYSKSIDLISFCVNKGIPIQYASSASVYGNSLGKKEDPLNCYAFSKLCVDNYVRDLIRSYQEESGGKELFDLYGCRYYNVFGPGEAHKDGQASPVYKFWKQFITEGKIDVFKEEAKRDFIHVDDVCEFHLRLMQTRPPSDIFDVGTGTSTSFLEIAKMVEEEMIARRSELQEVIARSDQYSRQFPYLRSVTSTELSLIEEVPFPKSLIGKYQYHTQAPRPANKAGMLTVRQGVAQYVDWLERQSEKELRGEIL